MKLSYFFFYQNVNQANNVKNEATNNLQNQIKSAQIQTPPQQKQQQDISQPQQKPKPKALLRKMDLSEYDTANDDIIAVSSAPESAVTSDERVNMNQANKWHKILTLFF